MSKRKAKSKTDNTSLNVKVEDDYIFDDGLDEIDYGHMTLMEVLRSRKFILVVSVLIFVFVCILAGKAFYYGDKTHHYEEAFVQIKERNEELTRVYETKEFDTNKLKNVAASEFVSCINSSIDANNLSDGIKNVLKDINDYYGKSRNYFAFKYEDIYTGFSVSYNEHQGISAASAIKAPTDIYIWNLGISGNISLDDTLTYTRGYYDYGTGILKTKKYNTSYTIRELLNYSIIYSDNAAHNMLMDTYGRINMLNYWQNKGTEVIFKYNTNWGVISAHDAAIYMRELYNMYLDYPEYGEMAMSDFLNSEPKFLDDGSGYKVANKYGWSGSSIHDVAIIFADNPYILIGLSNLGDKSYEEYFKHVREFGNRLHTEYWKYKMEICNSIKQY